MVKQHKPDQIINKKTDERRQNNKNQKERKKQNQKSMRK